MVKSAKAANSTIGLSRLVFAPLITDNDKIAAYGELRRLPGAIEATVTPGGGEPSIQYADDIEFAVLWPDPEITVRIRVADLPLAMRQLFVGGHMDANGVWVKGPRKQVRYFAVGWRALKSDGKYRYTWLYKCRARETEQSFGTRQGASINRREPEIEFTAIRLRYSGAYQAVADEGQNGFVGGSAFLGSVYGYPGDYSLLLDDVNYAVEDDENALILTTDPTATYSLSESGTALIITTT